MECDCLYPEEDQDLVTDTRSGDTICTSCARVVEGHMIDQRPEWYDDVGARAGPADKFEPYIGPQIDTGRGIRYHDPDPHKNTKIGLALVETCASKLYLDPDHQMTKTAKTFYADFAEARKAGNRTIRENQRVCAAAVALYFGCKSHERHGDRNPRTIKEISTACDAPLHTCADLIKDYKMMLMNKPYFKLLFTTVNPRDLLTRALNGITFKDRGERSSIEQRSLAYFDAIKTRGLLEGKVPQTVCSAVVYRSFQDAGIKIMKKDVYEACGVSSVTMNKALADLSAL